MDWTAIIGELGGGLSASVIVALAWALWKERQRTTALTDRLIDQSQSHLVDAVQREREIMSTLQSLTEAIKGGPR